ERILLRGEARKAVHPDLSAVGRASPDEGGVRPVERLVGVVEAVAEDRAKLVEEERDVAQLLLEEIPFLKVLGRLAEGAFVAAVGAHLPEEPVHAFKETVAPRGRAEDRQLPS